jgi:hypothetical protein
MLKRYPFIFLILFALSGCNISREGSNVPVVGSGTIISNERAVAHFTSINATGDYDIEIVCQQNQNFELTGDDNIIPLVVANVKDEILYIKPHRAFNPSKRVRLKIIVPTLDSISIEGSSNLQITEVKNDRLDMELNGTGKIYIAGEARAFNLSMTGTGYANVKELKTERASVSNTGTGNIDVFVTEELLANVNGTGNINYYGNTKIVNKNVSGTGGVWKK